MGGLSWWCRQGLAAAVCRGADWCSEVGAVITFASRDGARESTRDEAGEDDGEEALVVPGEDGTIKRIV